MRFSIIIPAHNAADRIRNALESIKKQTFTDYELIVICDSCDDNTAEIAKEYTDKVLKVHNHRDGLTRNAGLDIANGEYILFMDDDDWWLHEYVLDMINKKLDKEPCDVLCFAFIWKTVGYAGPLDNGGGHFVAVWNKCWRREYIGKTRFNNIQYGSDVVFNSDMFFVKSPRVVNWEMPLYYYNFLREGSLSDLYYKGVIK